MTFPKHINDLSSEWQEKAKNGETKAGNKALFICKKHGGYEQTLYNHKGPNSCPQCATETRNAKRARKDYPFMDEITPYWQEKIRRGECSNHIKIEFICEKHGVYLQSLQKHLRGQGCPVCGGNLIKTDYPFMNEIVPYWQEKIKKGECNCKTKVEFICEKHGSYLQTLSGHSCGKGCPICGNERNGERCRKKDYSFIDEITPEFQEKIKKGECKSPDKIELVCKKHGNYFSTLNQIQTKANKEKTLCPQCLWEEFRKNKIRVDYPFLDEIVQEDREKITNKTLKAHDKVRFICEKHGEYEQALNTHRQGGGCPYCGREKTALSQIRRDYPFMDEITKEYQEKIKRGECRNHERVEFICKKHGIYLQTLIGHLRGSGCPRCSHNVSKQEAEIVGWLKTIAPDTDILTNSKKILDGLEIDIYIPSKKFGIELNGVYWHSNLTHPNDYKVHIDNKRKMAQSKGIFIMNIWDLEWNDPQKQEILKDYIKARLGLLEYRIPARKCICREINSKEKADFLNKYHILGNFRDTISYGLEYKEEIVAVMTFKQNHGVTGDINITLNRWCCKGNTVVQGGFSKLFSYVIKQRPEWNKIVTHTDLRFSHPNENVHNVNGFTMNSYLSPSPLVVKKRKPYNLLPLKKKTIKENFPSVDITKSISQLIEELRIMVVYDCGKTRNTWIRRDN